MGVPDRGRHDGLLPPAAHAVGKGGEDGADDPGDEQGQEERGGGAGAHGAALGAGEELQAVGDGHPDDNRGDDGDPHGGHGIARAPHHAGEDLGHAHGDVAHCQNPQHPHAGGDDLRGGGEHLHQVLAEQQDEGHQHHGDAQADFQAVLHALLHPVDAAGADVLAGVGGHGGAKGEVGHHGEAVHAHHSGVGRDNHRAEGVCQGLEDNHGKGENGLGQAAGQPQADELL